MLSDPVEITHQSDESPVIFAPGGNVICEGDTLILKSSPGQNYEWSNGIHSEQIINVSESGIYTVAIDGICNQEQLFSLPLTVDVLTSIPPVADDVVILEGDSVLLMASGENCQWYDQPIGGNLLATGPMLQTMPLTSSATYYVESHHLYNGRTQTGGKQDTTGMNGIPSQGGFLIFEAWTPFNLVSVDVYVPSTGPLIPRFVQLWSKDSLLAFKRFELQPGINTLDLNFNVPVGKFSLQCQQGNLWRNTGSLNYPYLIGDAGQINTSSFGDNYYYYFYDWKIKKADLECISERTAVQVLLSGRQEFDIDTIVSVSPNPTSGFVWVDLNEQISGIKWIRILDFNGHEVLFLNTGLEAGFRLDFKNFPAGVYCLQISGDSFFETKTILKI
jgi:hypothetical protein